MEQKNTVDNFTALDPSKGLLVSKELIARKNQDGTVIIMKLDESTHFYKIDGIAADVWFGLAQQRSSLLELMPTLKSKYPKFQTELDADVPKFVLELLNKKLLTYC